MDLSSLRRYPDIEGPGLSASDAADRLILDEAAALLEARISSPIVVIDDGYGALALSVADAGGSVRVHQDLLTGERALAENGARGGLAAHVTSMPLTPELVAGATLVLMRVPRSLDRLDEVAGLVARHADPTVALVAGGRVKHMSTAMNDILRQHFSRVDVSHARQKSRVLTATGPATPAASPWPKSARHDDLGLTLVAHGGVFAGTKVDIGTRFLLEQLGDAVPAATTAVDLACGNGIVAAWLATHRGLTVLAGDRSASAIASARATAAANGVDDRVSVVHADGLEHLADESADLIVLNPPFHADAALSTGIASHLFADAARVLAPDGELWCVWNSHLRYRGVLERIVGSTRQIARNAKFTVTASTAQSHAGR